MLQFDDEGYLKALDDWNEGIAVQIAESEGIQLTPDHWELIHVIRDFYKQYQLSPAMRPLIKAVRITLGDEKAKSLYLMKLFPGSPAKLLAKIAGLPKPDNCL